MGEVDSDENDDEDTHKNEVVLPSHAGEADWVDEDVEEQSSVSGHEDDCYTTSTQCVWSDRSGVRNEGGPAKAIHFVRTRESFPDDRWEVG